MFEPLTVVAVAAIFLTAGAIKGVIGLGLPTVSLGLLSVALDLPTAMALLLMPSFVTNVWQAYVGEYGRLILRRIWPFLAMATSTVWIGTRALTRADPTQLMALLGLLLVIYGGLNLAGFRLSIPRVRERWAGPSFGAVNGLLTGMTGSFVVPGVMYLQGIGLPRDALVQAMGMLFSLSTIALALALGTNALLSAELVGASLIAVVPALIGMKYGQAVRHRLSEAQFRVAFFTSITGLGLYILVRTVG